MVEDVGVGDDGVRVITIEGVVMIVDVCGTSEDKKVLGGATLDADSIRCEELV